MKRQTRNQKGFSPIFAIVIVGVVIVIIALFLTTQTGSLPIFEKAGNQQVGQNVPSIQSSNDLNKVASDLDNTDMSQFDKELNQLDSDISSF